MPIRLSGLTSGLDTEAIVGALVSAYSYKKDKYTKAQTKLTWKQDAWKSLNSKVYSLYTEIGNMRYSGNYALRKTTLSDNTKASVTASGNAITGTQTLEIKKLAKTAYITGGELASTTTEKTTLKDLGLASSSTSGNANIEVRTGTSTKTITVDGNTTVSEFVDKLNGAGVQASFDDKHHRIYVSAKSSGKDGDFSISANNTTGLSALQSVGLLSDTEVESFNSTDVVDKNLISKTFTFAADGQDNNILTKDIAGFKDMIDLIQKSKNALADNPDDEEAKAVLEDTAIKRFAEYLDNTYPPTTSTTTVTDPETGEESQVTNTTYWWQVNSSADNLSIATSIYNSSTYDTHAAEETAANISKAVNAIRDAYVTLNSKNPSDSAIQKANKTLEQYSDWKNYIESTFGTTNSADDASYSNFWTQSDNKELAERVQYRVALTMDVGNGTTTLTSNAKKIDGQDAEFIINNENYTSNSNTITVNGLTVEALAETTDAINITVSNDTEGLYDKIKDFLTTYNNLINEMQKLYNADSAKDYEPLTDDEKSQMNETEIEKWEQKIKDSLLRRDTTLSGLVSSLTMGMMKTYEINGNTYSWSTFGVKTLGTLRAEKNENYAYHIDGDSEDSYTSGNQDRLKAAIASDPDAVIEFMKNLTTDMYNNLDKRMKSTAVKSVYTVYNDKEMASEYSNYSDLIKQWTNRIKDQEDAYYKKFSQMESALAKLQSNSSSLTSMLGG